MTFTLKTDIAALILDNDSCFGWSLGDRLHDAQKARQVKGVAAMEPFYAIAGLTSDGTDEHGYAMDFPALAYANYKAGPLNFKRFEEQVFDLCRPFEQSGYNQWLVCERDVVDNIEWLVTNGVKVAIYTSGTARHTKACMRAKGLSDYFDSRNIYDVVKTAPDFKPSAEAYQKVCDGLGVMPERTVMVDDGIKHLVEAHRLGAQTVLFDQFDRFPQLEQHAPHDRIRSISGFLNALRDGIAAQRGIMPTRAERRARTHGPKPNEI